MEATMIRLSISKKYTRNSYAYVSHKIPKKYSKYICEFYDAQNLTQRMIDNIVRMLENNESIRSSNHLDSEETVNIYSL
jgi:hypothetical protein